MIYKFFCLRCGDESTIESSLCRKCRAERTTVICLKCCKPFKSRSQHRRLCTPCAGTIEVQETLNEKLVRKCDLPSGWGK